MADQSGGFLPIGPDPDLQAARTRAINQATAPDVELPPPEHPAVTYAKNLLSPLGVFGNQERADMAQPYVAPRQPTFAPRSLAGLDVSQLDFGQSPSELPYIPPLNAGTPAKPFEDVAVLGGALRFANQVFANAPLGENGAIVAFRNYQNAKAQYGVDSPEADQAREALGASAVNVVAGLGGQSIKGEVPKGPLGARIAAREASPIAAKVAAGEDLTKLPARAASDVADAAAGRVPTTDVSTQGFLNPEQAITKGDMVITPNGRAVRVVENYTDGTSKVRYVENPEPQTVFKTEELVHVTNYSGPQTARVLAAQRTARQAPDQLAIGSGNEAPRYAVEVGKTRSVIKDTQTGETLPQMFTGKDLGEAAAQAKADALNAIGPAGIAVPKAASIQGALSQVSEDVETAVRRSARELPGITAEDIAATPEVRAELDDALRVAKVATSDENATALAQSLLDQEVARPSLGNIQARTASTVGASAATTAEGPHIVSIADPTTNLVRGMREAGATEDEIASFIGQKPPPPTSGEPPVPPIGGKDGFPPGMSPKVPEVSRPEMASAMFRNYIVSNALSPYTFALKAGSDLIKAADTTIEAITQGVRAGRPSQIPGSIRSLYAGFMRGVTQDAITAFKNRQYALGAEGKTHVIDQMLSGSLGNGAKRAAQASEVLSLGSPIPRSISALTAVFQRGYRDMALYEEGYAAASRLGMRGGATDQYASRFMSNPDEFGAAGKAALERATKEANTRTWTNSNPLSRIPGRDKPVLGDALFTITPFVNLVTNVAREGLEFIPGLGAAGKLAEGFQKGGLSSREWARLAQHQFMGAVGTYVLAQKAGVGEVTGDGPNDDNKRFDLIQQGWKPNHIKMGDTWYPNIAFGPIAPLLNAVGNTHDNLVYNTAAQDRDSVGSKVGSAINGVVKGELDTAHWLDALLNLSSALNGSKSEQQAFVNQWISLGVPQGGTLKTIERALENATPAIAPGADLMESMRQRFFRQYPPALRPSDLQNMPPGVPRSDTGIGGVIPLLGSPGQGGGYDGVGTPEGSPTYGTDLVLREAARLGGLDNSWRSGGVLNSPSPTIGQGESAIRLDAISARSYIQAIGEQRQRVIGALISSSKYTNATASQQKDLFDKALTQADDFGRTQYLAKGVVDATDPKLITAQAVAGFRSQNTNKDRAYWVALLDRANKLTPDVAKAIDSLKEPLPDQRVPISVEEYRTTAPLIHEYLKHVPFGTDKSPIGTPADWTAVAAAVVAKNNRRDELIRAGANTAVADVKAQQEIMKSLSLVQRNLFLNGAQLENPLRKALAKKYPTLAHFISDQRAPNETDEAYQQFPLAQR